MGWGASRRCLLCYNYIHRRNNTGGVVCRAIASGLAKARALEASAAGEGCKNPACLKPYVKGKEFFGSGDARRCKASRAADKLAAQRGATNGEGSN